MIHGKEEKGGGQRSTPRGRRGGRDIHLVTLFEKVLKLPADPWAENNADDNHHLAPPSLVPDDTGFIGGIPPTPSFLSCLSPWFLETDGWRLWAGENEKVRKSRR